MLLCVVCSYGFVEFMGEEDAEFACKVLNMVKLWGKPVRVSKASSRTQQLDIGANLFVGNLDPDLDEKMLYDTFAAFGVLLQPPRVVRDPGSGTRISFSQPCAFMLLLFMRFAFCYCLYFL